MKELKYSTTNTYLIEGTKGNILFDTGWAGLFPAFCQACGSQHIKVQDIDYIMISHFHPDHMGIAQEIADIGSQIVVVDIQREFLHASDAIFQKEKKIDFKPIDDNKVRILTIENSRSFLKELGIDGEIIHTPGHSDDSISLWLDNGELYVGDLNPLYELELHRGTLIEASWKKLMAMRPKVVYYGHAKTAHLDDRKENLTAGYDTSRYEMVSRMIKYIDKGYSMEKIARKTGADIGFVEDVNRMYLTHQNVGVQGILDRIEIKNR